MSGSIKISFQYFLFFSVVLVGMFFCLTSNQSTLAISQKPNDINVADRSGQTLLMKAVISNKLNEVKDLIAKKANVDAQDNDGVTALIWAVTVNNIELVKTLLDAGADFNIKDKKGNSAVMYAHNVGFKDIAGLLRGAKDSFGRNSLIKAVAFDDKAEVLSLLKYGFDVNSADEHGFTPLMYAATGGNKQMVLLLLANGASSSVTADNGKDATSLAFDFNHTDVVELLEQRAKNSNRPKSSVSFTDADTTKRSSVLSGLSGSGTSRVRSHKRHKSCIENLVTT